MISKFPLLKLPTLAQLEVFGELPAVDILNISFTSIRLRYLLQAIRLRAIEHNVHFEREYPHITTVFKKDDGLEEHLLTWEFVPRESLDGFPTSQVTVGCHRFKRCVTSGSCISADYHDPEFGMSVIFNYIFQLLPGPVNLFFNLQYVRNLYAILLNENFKNCRKLYIWEGYEYTSNDVDLHEILELVNVQKELECHMTRYDDLDCHQIQNLDHVVIHSAKWLTLQSLYSLKCRTGKFLCHNLNTGDIVAFAQNWLNSEDTTLESMQFGWDDKDEDFISDATRRDLGWKRWDPKVRSKFFYSRNDWTSTSRVNCSSGLDITRPDGLTATILLLHRYESNVLFLVWHDTRPEIARLKELNSLVSKEFVKFDNIFKRRTKNGTEDENVKNIRRILNLPVVDYSWERDWEIKRFTQKMKYEVSDSVELVINKIVELKKEISKWESGED